MSESMLINLELYRVFYVVAKTGSLTKAKKELFISQPAISQAIKQLETQLGGRLFIRTSKGMELTSEGKMMFEYVEQAYGLITMAEHKFSQMKGIAFGEISIGASDTLSKFFLINHIRRFREKYQDINIRITNRTTDENIALLKAGKIDMAIINYNQSISEPTVEFTPCASVGECFVANRDWMARLPHPLSAEELCNYPLIMLERKSGTRREIENAIIAAGGTVHPTLELCSVDMIVECAKIGMGIGLVTKEFVAEDLAKGVLCEVPICFSLPRRNITIATMRGAPLNFAATKFMEAIIKTD